MPFILSPILDDMAELYRQPRSPERFRAYLSRLQTENYDLALPIMGYNPMAKDHVLEKLAELRSLDAESIVSEVLEEVNVKVGNVKENIRVVLNLADDLHGAWTNRYATDFDATFKLNALVTRNFSTPYFWTSEDYTPELIRRRTLAATWRTQYWRRNPKPRTLSDFVVQEVFVARMGEFELGDIAELDFTLLEELHATYPDEDDYGLLFNFFYTDLASASLGYPCFGVSGSDGFDYAAYLARL